MKKDVNVSRVLKRKYKSSKNILPITLIALVVITTFTLGVGVEASSNYVVLRGSTNMSVSRALLDLVNQARNQAGLNSLTYDYGMQTHVEQRAVEISIYFEHQKPDGRDPFADYFVGSMGENIQAQSSSGSAAEQAQAIFDSFKASPGHWANMMNPNWTVMAVGTWYAGAFVKGDNISNRVHVVQWFSNVASGASQSSGAGASRRTVYYKSLGSLTANVNSGKIEVIKNNNAYGDLNGWSYRLPIDASNFTYASSNTNAISVDANGNLQAVGPGRAQISIYDKTGSLVTTISVSSNGSYFSSY